MSDAENSVQAGPPRESRNPQTWAEWVAMNNRTAESIFGSIVQLRRESSGGEYDQGHAVAVDYDALTDCLDALTFLVTPHLSEPAQDEIERTELLDLVTKASRLIEDRYEDSGWPSNSWRMSVERWRVQRAALMASLSPTPVGEK